MSLAPKNWSSFQHYKDRSPVWIKLHRKLLDDFAYARLPLASRALAPMLWLLASEYEDGKITASLEEIAFRLRVTEQEIADAVKPLVEKGFFIDDSNLLADCEQVAMPEKRREETETQVETEREKISRASARESDWPPDFFDQFWSQYPKHVEKKKTQAILDRMRKRADVPWLRLIGGVMRYAQAVSDPRYTKNPPTWLNAGCWDDELPQSNGRDHGRQTLADLAFQLADEVRERELEAGVGRSPDVVRGH